MKINALFVPPIIVLSVLFTKLGNWGAPIGWAIGISIIILIEEKK